MARQQDPFIGRDVLNGQFQILQKIGSGGMGSVYKALQPAMNRMVAIKILHPKLASRKDLVSRFRREARAMSHLTHPNTVKVYLYGELEDGSLYIVMEYLEGKNLNQTVRSEGPMTIERGLPILIQACNALDEAHRAGIIHRDLKPENIFVTSQGGMKDFAKVLDFGLAKVTEREMRPGSIILTQEGMVFGTPEFMSPEQAQGKSLTPGSDIYSLAVILYEVLTGKLPFDAKNPMEYIQLHVTTKPKPINERVPGKTFPPLLWTVLVEGAREEVRRSLPVGGRVRACAPGGAQRHRPRCRRSWTVLPARSCRRRATCRRRCAQAAIALPRGRSDPGAGALEPAAATGASARRSRRSVSSSGSRSRSSSSARCSRRSCSSS